MSPSIHEDPVDLHRTPRQSRLTLYSDLGRAIAASESVVLQGQALTTETMRVVAAGVVRELVHQGYEFLLNDKLVDLSRYEETDDPRHTWLR